VVRFANTRSNSAATLLGTRLTRSFTGSARPSEAPASPNLYYNGTALENARLACLLKEVANECPKK